MGHCISVYLMCKSDLRNEKIDSIVDGKSKNDISWVELGEGIISACDIPNIVEYRKGKTIASIETDYFSGGGYQSAKLFVDNKKVYDDSSEFTWKNEPINTVLRMMGVTAKTNLDEFDTIGLGNYRSNEDFK